MAGDVEAPFEGWVVIVEGRSVGAFTDEAEARELAHRLRERVREAGFDATRIELAPTFARRRLRLRRLADCIAMLEAARYAELTTVTETMARAIEHRVPTVVPGMSIMQAMEEMQRAFDRAQAEHSGPERRGPGGSHTDRRISGVEWALGLADVEGHTTRPAAS